MSQNIVSFPSERIGVKSAHASSRRTTSTPSRSAIVRAFLGKSAQANPPLPEHWYADASRRITRTNLSSTFASSG